MSNHNTFYVVFNLIRKLILGIKQVKLNSKYYSLQFFWSYQLKKLNFNEMLNSNYKIASKHR